MKWLLLLAIALTGLAGLTGCREDDYLSYTWDDRDVLCSLPVDDITESLEFSRLDAQLRLAAEEGWVTMIHAHQPGITIRQSTIERILATADQYHLQYVTFDQLTPEGPHVGGLAFAFDDDDVDGWFALEDTFRAHHAHLTFFVTRWYLLTQDKIDKLAMLAADGHDLEAHSHDHLNAVDYVAAHSLDDYLNQQVLPSIQIMQDAGYHPTSFAFPYGATNPTISAEVLKHIDRVRTTPGPCPNTN